MQFAVPHTIESAVEVLSSATCRTHVLAGGTDLLVQMRSGMLNPDLVVDIKRIPGLDTIAVDDDGFHIGAAVPGAVLGDNAELKAAWPGVVEAVELIGSTQIQGRATLVGNLCNASPAADSVPALITANAAICVAGPGGQREVPAHSFILGPGTNCLGTGEFVTGVRLPPAKPRSSDAYLRLIPRSEMDIAVVGAAVRIEIDTDGVCLDAHVALGAVAPRAITVEAGNRALIGSRLDTEALDALAAAASQACDPIDDKRGTIRYRRKVAGVLARRAAVIACNRAGMNG